MFCDEYFDKSILLDYFFIFFAFALHKGGQHVEEGQSCISAKEKEEGIGIVVWHFLYDHWRKQGGEGQSDPCESCSQGVLSGGDDLSGVRPWDRGIEEPKENHIQDHECEKEPAVAEHVAQHHHVAANG